MLSTAIVLLILNGCSDESEPVQTGNPQEIAGTYSGNVTTNASDEVIPDISIVVEYLSEGRVTLSLPADLLPFDSEGLQIECSVSYREGIYSLSGEDLISIPGIMDNVPINIVNSTISTDGHAIIEVEVSVPMLSVSAYFTGNKNYESE